ncbi:hypothetical protein [Priestia megaterium]|uniref:hypothetical protein n=1 Tax=Priestia megaterium TaxID=1404 RepID=UPI002877C4DA|nr:hypothetical protein [Priestia megaterium]
MANIKDNYSFQELEYMFKGANDLKSFLRQGKRLGFSTKQSTIFFSKIKKMEKEFNSLRNLPDTFNKHFSERGWFAYESLDTRIMEKSIKLAEQGNVDEGEQLLINHFMDRDSIGVFIAQLSHMKEFKARHTLFWNAVEDHFEGRYYASVPVMLMMMDGFVSDIGQKGFFAESVDLNAWDSVAAHSSGLQKMASIFGDSREETTDEKITLPYRHGILHGRDLGYANVHVSAKTLSTLLALGDWARVIRDGKNDERKEFTPPTMEEAAQVIITSVEQRRENRKIQKYLDQWKARNIEVGIHIPEKGEINDYEEDTPEQTVVSFLHFLLRGNYGGIAKLTCQSWRKNKSIGVMAGEVREFFKHKKLTDYKLVSVQDTAAACTTIYVWMQLKRENDTYFEHEAELRVIFENKEGELIPRGFGEGKWKFLKHSLSGIEWSDIKAR